MLANKLVLWTNGKSRLFIATIRNNVRKEKEDIKARLCPKCGGVLKERNGKYGTFMGCSNYPKCRFTVK